MSKKTILFSLLLFILYLFQPATSKAQLRLENEPQVVSPNVGEMIKADNYSVDLYTGRMTVSIPIYTYTDVDFTVPISLIYNYNGMRPNEVPSEVGLGWFLDCGGAITREVNGFPDEERGAVQDVIAPLGLAYKDVLEYDSIPIRDSPSQTILPTINPLSTNETSLETLKATLSCDGKSYDYSPDVYHFSFMGYSGSFVREYDGSFTAFETRDAQENYRISKTNRASEDGSSFPYSEFTIIRGDGYKYIFGSLHEKYLYNDRSARRMDDRDDLPIDKHFESRGITSWKLRKVIAPSGRVLSFVYGWKNEPSIISHSNATKWESIVEPLNGYGQSRIATTTDKTSYTYGAVLEGIEVNGSRVASFYYDARPSDKSAQWVVATSLPIEVNNKERYSPLLLREVVFRNAAATLTHTFNTNGNPYPFLSEVTIEGLGTYHMDYNNDDNCCFPPYGTNATDHWGYQNSNNYSICNQSSVSWDTISRLGSHYSEIIGSRKNTDPSSSSNGLMTKLSYPTGGWTSFEYQPNDFSHRLDRRPDSLYEPQLFAENGTGPGHRIYKVSHYDSNGILLDGREYRYRLSENNGMSSGQLLASPRYRVAYQGSAEGFGISPLPIVVHYGTTNSITSFESVYLEYPRVEEIRLDGGRTVYTFSSWNEVPDSFGYQLLPLQRIILAASDRPQIAEITNIPEQWILNSILLPGANLQPKRGKLLSVSSISADSNSVDRIVENTYNIGDKTLRALMSSFVNVGDKCACVPVITDQYDIVQTSTTDIFPSGSTTVSTSFTYNSEGRIVSETKGDSNGNLLRTSYRYLSDIQVNNRTATQQEMYEAGYTSLPISLSKEIKRQGESTWKTEQMTQYEYAAYNNQLGKPYYGLSIVREKDMDAGTYYNKYKYVFGPNGQMTQRIDANGNYTSYVWSFGGNGVALIIENASNQEIRNISGMSDLFTQELSTDSTETIAAILRTALPKARITSVTYYSYNHPSRITDPFGKTTTYEYDSNERLISTAEEGIGKLNSYYYNTKTR